MQQLKFSDNQDILYVYDDDKVNSSKLLAAWTKGNTSNTTITALSGSMYIIFKSSGSGVDSGFIGNYTSILDSSAFTPSIDFTHDSVLYNGVPTIFKSVNTSFPGIPNFKWKIDGTLISAQKNCRTTQYTDATYQVCMQTIGCGIDTNICKYVKVITPNSKTAINFSKTTFSNNSDTAWFKPITDKANKFTWTISPSSYVLLNPPPSPSIVKPGSIQYRYIYGDSLPTPHIWFLDSTCYTITLKAWNDLDSSSTVSTLTKNKYICSKDFRLTYGLFGKVFNDNNNDCGFSSGETCFKDIPVKLYDTTNQFLGQTYTLSNGMFFFEKTNGKYKVVLDIHNLPLEVKCPIGTDSLISLKSSILSGGIDFPTNCGQSDFGIKSIAPRGYVFPGQTHYLSLKAGLFGKTMIENCQSNSDSGTIRLTVTGKVKYKSANLTPNSISGNTYTWKIKDFLKFNNAIQLQFKTDTTATYGDTVLAFAEIILLKKDKDSSNNKMKYSYKVMNSYDPNKKETYPEVVLPGYKDWMVYTIHFQNTGKAPAFNIRLEDTIDNRMDLESFEVMDYSHDNRVALNGNKLKLFFDDIMLPDSFSDSKASNGYVQYRIKPKQGYNEGTSIANTAYIYFDYNSPVATNTTINAYKKPSYLIKVTSGLNGSASGSGTYKKDSIVKAIATPNSCSKFKRWTEAGNEVSTDSIYTFVASANRTLIAEFTRNTYTIIGSILPKLSAGTINGLGVYACSDTLKTLTAVPSSCYQFKEWQENNVVVSTNANYSFLPNQKRIVKAIFEPIKYSINASASPLNSGTIKGTGNFNCSDTSISLSASASHCYQFKEWRENNSVVSTNATYTLSPKQARNLVAIFEPISYTINTVVTPTNSGTVMGDGIYNCDSSVILKAKANSGYKFSAWTENSVQISTDSNYAFTSAKDHMLTAVFTKSSKVSSIDASQFIYPNPANQFLYIKGIDLPLFVIYNAQGAMVYSGIVNDGRISINILSSGIYFLEMHSTDGELRMTTKFVKE